MEKVLQKCQEHQEVECHQVGFDYEVMFPKMHTHVAELANETTKQLRRENKRCFAKIVQSLQALMRQGLSVRGNDDINSKFTQVLKLQCLDDPLLAVWLEIKGDRYHSRHSQNEILSIMAKNVILKVVSNIGSKHFSIIADEYNDISNKEQLPFCFWWIDEDPNAHKEFLGFYQIKNTESNASSSALLDILVRAQLC